MLNVETFPLLLAILFLGLPFNALLALKFKDKNAKDANNYLVGTLLLIPLVFTIEYVTSKWLNREFTLQNPWIHSMLIYVGLALILWVWLRVFIYIDHRRDQNEKR